MRALWMMLPGHLTTGWACAHHSGIIVRRTDLSVREVVVIVDVRLWTDDGRNRPLELLTRHNLTPCTALAFAFLAASNLPSLDGLSEVFIGLFASACLEMNVTATNVPNNISNDAPNWPIERL